MLTFSSTKKKRESKTAVIIYLCHYLGLHDRTARRKVSFDGRELLETHISLMRMIMMMITMMSSRQKGEEAALTFLKSDSFDRNRPHLDQCNLINIESRYILPPRNRSRQKPWHGFYSHEPLPAGRKHTLVTLATEKKRKVS